MLKNFDIKPPFFEVGPKAIIWGDAMLALAKVIDKTAMKYDLDVIVTPQYTDIKLLADNTERILVFAQHMDALLPGRGLRIRTDSLRTLHPHPAVRAGRRRAASGALPVPAARLALRPCRGHPVRRAET